MHLIFNFPTLFSTRASVKRARGSLLTTWNIVGMIAMILMGAGQTDQRSWQDHHKDDLPYQDDQQIHLILAIHCRSKENQDKDENHLKNWKARQVELWSLAFSNIWALPAPTLVNICCCAPGIAPTDKCPDVSLRVNPPIPLQINPSASFPTSGVGEVGGPIVGNQSTPLLCSTDTQPWPID